MRMCRVQQVKSRVNYNWKYKNIFFFDIDKTHWFDLEIIWNVVTNFFVSQTNCTLPSASSSMQTQQQQPNRTRSKHILLTTHTTPN